LTFTNNRSFSSTLKYRVYYYCKIYSAPAERKLFKKCAPLELEGSRDSFYTKISLLRS